MVNRNNVELVDKHKYNCLPWWLRPSVVVIGTLFLSIIAWIIPVELVPHGFTTRQALTLRGLASLTTWYGLIFLFSELGFRWGMKTRRLRELEGGDLDRAFSVLLVLGTIGIMYIYMVAIGLENALAYISDRQANNLRYAIEGNYMPGLLSFRWASVPCGALGVYRVVKFRRIRAKDVWGMALLICNSMITSRLSLVMACLIFIGLYSTDLKRRLRFRTVVVLMCVAFIILTWLNYIRNAGFYETNYNISSPLLMNLSEITTYLAAPFQTSLFVANNGELFKPEDLEFFILSYVVPSYFVNGETLASLSERALYEGIHTYREAAGLRSGLTTNSAFADMIAVGGWAAWIYVAFVTLISAFLIGHFMRYKSVLMKVAAFTLLYAFAELWRVFIFNTGLVNFILISMFVSAIFSKVRVNYGSRFHKRISYVTVFIKKD